MSRAPVLARGSQSIRGNEKLQTVAFNQQKSSAEGRACVASWTRIAASLIVALVVIYQERPTVVRNAPRSSHNPCAGRDYGALLHVGASWRWPDVPECGRRDATGWPALPAPSEALGRLRRTSVPYESECVGHTEISLISNLQSPIAVPTSLILLPLPLVLLLPPATG